jgi:hypothetical protein
MNQYIVLNVTDYSWDGERLKIMAHTLYLFRGFKGLLKQRESLKQWNFIYMKHKNKTRNYDYSLEAVCEAELYELIDLMIARGGRTKYGLAGACGSGNEEFVKIMMKKCDENDLDWKRGLFRACENGHETTAKIALEKGIDLNSINWAFESACKGGYERVATLLISYGANEWDWGLYGACQAGNEALINLMISRGSINWNDALIGACRGGHEKWVDDMILRGATYWDGGFAEACGGGKKMMMEKLISEGVSDWVLKVSKLPICEPYNKIMRKMISKGLNENKCRNCNESIESHF